MLYRLKQFIWAITAHISEEEDYFVNQYLSPAEFKLFKKLRVNEQKHSLCVAKLMKECSKENEAQYIRLGLLHDIGKIKYPLNPVEKGIIVILDQLTKGKIQKLSGLKMVKCYYQHPDIGCQILLEIGTYDREFLEAIKMHHKMFKNNEEIVNALQRCDSET